MKYKFIERYKFTYDNVEYSLTNEFEKFKPLFTPYDVQRLVYASMLDVNKSVTYKFYGSLLTIHRLEDLMVEVEVIEDVKETLPKLKSEPCKFTVIYNNCTYNSLFRFNRVVSIKSLSYKVGVFVKEYDREYNLTLDGYKFKIIKTKK